MAAALVNIEGFDVKQFHMRHTIPIIPCIGKFGKTLVSLSHGNKLLVEKIVAFSSVKTCTLHFVLYSFLSKCNFCVCKNQYDTRKICSSAYVLTQC